jgi:hypothetical protein
LHERIYSLDQGAGILVPITIGPPYAEQERRFEAGAALIEKPTYAILSPAEEFTLISDRLQDELILPGHGLGRPFIPTLPVALRPMTTVIVGIDGFTRRSVDAFIVMLPPPIDCVIGRDILSVGTVLYDGPDETFRLRMPR